MTYQAIDQLTQDPIFAGRTRACCVEQAEVFKDDARPAFVALAADVARGNGTVTACFTRLLAAGPGIADKASTTDDDGNVTVDQALVDDADILTSVQANWEVVAALYYDESGAPRP